MQLNLNVTDTTNDKYRSYCKSRDISISHGISNLLMVNEHLETLLAQKDDNITDLHTIINLLKSRLGE